MTRYFTSVDLVDNMFVATVYNAQTNESVYKTPPYYDQSQATQDANTFLVTSKPPTTVPSPSVPTSQTIVNRIQNVNVSGTTRRCCGR
jgi:hypothetical protein